MTQSILINPSFTQSILINPSVAQVIPLGNMSEPVVFPTDCSRERLINFWRVWPLDFFCPFVAITMYALPLSLKGLRFRNLFLYCLNWLIEIWKDA